MSVGASGRRPVDSAREREALLARLRPRAAHDVEVSAGVPASSDEDAPGGARGHREAASVPSGQGPSA